MRPVVPWRRTGLVIVLVCLAAVLSGVIAFFHTSRSNAFDNRVGTWVIDTVSHRTLLHLLKITTPRWVFGAIAVLVVLLLVLRRFRLAAVAALGPGLTIVLTEWVIKPIVHRTYIAPIVVNGRELYLYPSGHEAGVATLTAVLVLIVAAMTSSRVVLALAIVSAAFVDFLAAVALVGNGFHFATDTIGAVCLSLACVIGCGLVIDLVVERRAARRGKQEV